MGDTRKQGPSQLPGRAQGRRAQPGVDAEQVRRRQAPPSQQVPGKEVGKPWGTPESLGAPGGPRLVPRATCRVRPLTWKGFSPRGTALPSDQRTLAFTPVRVPAPRTPPSASPASGSGARNVPPERSVGPEGTVCLHRPLGAQGPARGPACAMPSSAAPSEMQRPWAEKGCCRAAGPLGQRRGQAGRGDSLKSLAALNLPASNGPSQ